VHARLAGVERGFVFDVRDLAHPYVEVPHDAIPTLGPFARSELLDFVDPQGAAADPTNLLVFHATPLGSEYRVAYRDGGVPASPAVGAPQNIQLLTCRPNTANTMIPQLTKNWIEALISGHFNTLTNNKSVVWFQASLYFHAKTTTPPMFGMTGLRHDAPRRLRVRGDGIAPGAWLKLYAPKQSDITTATKTTPPTTTPTEVTHTVAFELPLHPGRDENGDLVWETAEEFESLYIYDMLNGGPNNFRAQLAIDLPNHPGFLQIVNLDLFEPMKWNWWFVEVRNDRNDPSTFANGGWQRILIE
jgi:hypothetical protein